MEALVIGIATAFNFIVIMFKFKRGRWEDAIFDTLIFIVISYMFAGTISGMSVGMVASAVVSIWMWFDPPNFLQDLKIK